MCGYPSIGDIHRVCPHPAGVPVTHPAIGILLLRGRYAPFRDDDEEIKKRTHGCGSGVNGQYAGRSPGSR